MTQLNLSAKRIWLAGGSGLLGQALLRRLHSEQAEVLAPTHAELDLCDRAATLDWAQANRPELAIIAAAAAGGLQAHLDRPADFLHGNLLIAANTIEAARAAGVGKLLFVASSAVYPPSAPQPFREESLLSGPLDTTHEGYALAKIAGIKLCQTYRRQYGCDFISVLPTNLYGPDARAAQRGSHVTHALLARFFEARCAAAEEVEVWGTGRARRELLHVDDAADACVHLIRIYSDEMPINLGTGKDIRIAELAALIAEITEYDGRIRFDAAKPDGAARRLLDVSRLAQLGWTARIDLRAGLEAAFRELQAHRVACAPSPAPPSAGP
ncbi:GDP-L-fucose synthase family protein [Phenylobacterium sp.]|uniref:GDP-L-fucose synthase family protein n=1 Tax=Phenylobacterium sp. TaxID=1871053 RepID=UPI0035C7F0AD